MFQSLHIHHFRGIKSAHIDGLRQVNLFFGKNNCGKSSVLEAIFLISGQSNPELPVKINNLRNYTRFSENDLAIEFYNLNQEKEIHISVEAEVNRDLKISPIRSNSKEISLKSLEEGVSSASAMSYGLKLVYTLGHENKAIYQSEIKIEQGENPKAVLTQDKRYQEVIFSQYLPSAYMQVPIYERYAKMVENKQEQAVIKTLQVIEPKIVDMQLVGNDLMVDIGLSQRLPVNVMGDGIRKLLSVILSVYECKNGILLIDEVDNGFHYSAMTALWKSILHAAYANNTQVFVTTYNIDSLKGLVAALQEEACPLKENVMAFKLFKRVDDEVVALNYDFEKMAYAIDQEMEMR